MNELDAIFAQILRDPTNNLNLLAYADRLDESMADRGEEIPAPRSELIRLQVASPGQNPEREAQVIGDVSRPFCGEEIEPGMLQYRRGWLHSITCPAEAWLAHGDAIREAEPLLKRVHFTTRPVPFVHEDTSPSTGTPRRIEITEDATGLTTLLVYRLRWPGINFTIQM